MYGDIFVVSRKYYWRIKRNRKRKLKWKVGFIKVIWEFKELKLTYHNTEMSFTARPYYGNLV